MELLHTAHVPAGAGPFPTILMLHGWGASAHDLLGLAPVVNKSLPGDDVLCLCPQGPLEFESAPGVPGFGWFPLSEGGEIEPAQIVGARGLLEGFLDDALERYPIDPERLLLLGFSQGGVMAYDLALGRPERFKALIALSSWLPEAVLGGLPESAAEARKALPTLVVHGTKDPMIPIDRARESMTALQALGMEPAWGEYEMGHEVAGTALRDLLGWLHQGPLAVAPE